MKTASATLTLIFATITGIAEAYETPTHAYVAAESYDRSVLANTAPGSIWSQLGFDRLDLQRPFHTPLYPVPQPDPGLQDTLGDIYLDLVPQGVGFTLQVRAPYTAFERKQIDQLLAKGRFSGIDDRRDLVFLAKGWLARGAIREDDLKDGGEEGYDDDPSGNMWRVLNHFYDPINNNGFGSILGANALCLFPNQSCQRAIDWATGLTDALAGNPRIAPQYRNHFSWASAREAEYQALTFASPTGGIDMSERRNDSQLRAYYWATAFRAFGDSLHLLGDMAQPQHTRQDIHPPVSIWLGAEFLHRQAFEAYTDLRVTRDDSSTNQEKSILRHINGTFPSKDYVSEPSLGNYPNTAFSTVRKFFSSQTANPSGMPNIAEILSRRGLADYSNRGFFTDGTFPGSPGTPYPMPPSDLSDSGYSEQPTQGSLWINQNQVRFSQLTRAVPDSVAPGYVDSITAQYGGKVPLATTGVWKNISLTLFPSIHTEVLDIYNYRVMADMLLPRAVGYSTGMINHFFRGRLEVLPPLQGSFAAVNQVDPHYTDVNGYPRRTVDDAIFGFEKVRVRVRNATAIIVESGTGESFPQYIGDPDGGGPLRGELIAVARYHRNTCYQPDLSGERIQGYAPPPGTGTITEPTCVGGRTGYQEISVSAPLTLTAANGNAASELDNLAAGTGIEKVFDFTADPIPINATDLFIQVVYRGRMGVDQDSLARPGNFEPDAIAVGSHDAREPTFITFYNSTDYFNSNGTWLAWNTLFPLRTTFSFWVCAGAAANRRLAWSYFNSIKGGVAMGVPDNTGYVRLAFITGLPVGASLWTFRGVPDSAETPEPLDRSVFTRGQIKQANREQVAAAALSTPFGNCDQVTPGATEYWCQDPIRRRRSLILGFVAQPIYQELAGSAAAPDVDSVPLPSFSVVNARTGGTLSYNDAVLMGCPTQTAARPEQTELSELLEELGTMGN